VKRQTLVLAALCLVALAAENATVAPQTFAGHKSAVVGGIDAITIPRLLSYQGRLTDTFGIAVADTTHNLTFRLYTQPSGGSAFWNETQSVATRTGLFSVLLGSTTPIGSMPDAGALYLGMAVEYGAELMPRLRIASAAYAYLSERAANADLLQGKDTMALDGRYVNEGQTNSVTSGMIADGTVAAADLGQMGAASGQVLKWTGSAWAPRNDSVGGGGSVPDSVPGSFAVSTDLRVYGKGRIGDNVNSGTHAFAAGSGNSASGNYSSVTGGADNTASGGSSHIGGGQENYASGYRAFIGGGYVNEARDTGATVVGGYENIVEQRYGVVVGGKTNRASSSYSAVLGGGFNAASGSGAVVGGGLHNLASGSSSGVYCGDNDSATGDYSFIGGGYHNDARTMYSTVGGGDRNASTALCATVGGGSLNAATGFYSSVAGGNGSSAGGRFSAVGGGSGNSAGDASDDTAATVAGGGRNLATAIFATVGGGSDNQAGDKGSIVAGGSHNVASGPYSCVVGGYQDTAASGYSCVVGGSINRAAGYMSGVVSGTQNLAEGYYSVVVGGGSNSALGTGSAVVGGSSNRAAGLYGFIGGGYDNSVDGSHSAIAGGKGDTVSAHCAAVLSGRGNRAGDALDDSGAVVCGGFANRAVARFSIAGGGANNTASDYGATVGGGGDNVAAGAYATVAGGSSNQAIGSAAAVGGGMLNAADGVCSAVPGGYRSGAERYCGLAAGHRALARHAGCFVWGDSAAPTGADTVYSTANNQWVVRSRGGVWFYSNLAMTTGAYLAPGTNAWTSACDSATKEDFRTVDRKELLERVAVLRVRDYKMKDQNDGTRHIGPVAQDFHAAFGYGETEKGINTADADGVLLAAVQALYEQNQVQQAEIDALKAELQRR
jgi:hypothetical protein